MLDGDFLLKITAFLKSRIIGIGIANCNLHRSKSPETHRYCHGRWNSMHHGEKNHIWSDFQIFTALLNCTIMNSFFFFFAYISWSLRVREEVQADGRNKAVLEVEYVSAEVAGKYLCQATNPYGIAKLLIALVVEGTRESLLTFGLWAKPPRYSDFVNPSDDNKMSKNKTIVLYVILTERWGQVC